MAASYVQGAINENTAGGTTVAVSLTGVTANNLLVIGTSCEAGATVSGVATTAGTTSTWTKAVAQAGSTSAEAGIWYTIAPATGSYTVTVTVNATDAPSAVLAEYSGVATTSPLNTVGSGTATSGTAPAATSATTTNATDLVVGVVSVISNVQTITSSDVTIRKSFGDATLAAAIALGDKNVTSTGAQTANFTITTSTEWADVVATFKAASGSTPKSASDSATESDGPLGIALSGPSDGATSGETAALALPASDTGSLTEGVQVGPNSADGAALAEAVGIAPATSDGAALSESSSLAVSLAGSDLASAADSASVASGTVAIAASDTAALEESASISVSLAVLFDFATGAQGFTATAGANSTLSWSSATGNPAGSLQASITGRSFSNANFWQWSGTWQSLGVAAGATVQSVKLTGASTKCGTYTTGASSTIGPYELRDGSGTLLFTFWSGRTVTAVDASWVSVPASSVFTLAAAQQPASATVDIRLSDTLATGNSASANVVTFDDQVGLTIVYTLPTALTLAASDAASLTESASVSQGGTTPQDSDGASLTDGTVGIALPASDAASLLDTPALGAALAGADSGSLTESLTLGAAVAGADSATGADSPSLAAAVATSDAASLTEIPSVNKGASFGPPGMKIISRGGTVYKNGVVDSVGQQAVDASYGTDYNVTGGSNTYIVDLGATTYTTVLINWWDDSNTSSYDPALVGETGSDSLLSNYLLSKSANLTGPWTTVEDHTSTTNPYGQKVVQTNMSGFRYLRWSSITIAATGGTSAFQVNVHDASASSDFDAFFIAGDSWAAQGQIHRDTLSPGNSNAQWSLLSLQQQLQAKRGLPVGTEPIIIDGGVGGITVSGASGYTANRTTLLADAAAAGLRYCGIQLGTNDANNVGGTLTGANITQYQTDLLTLIDYAISLGMTPILATIPWGSASTWLAGNANTLNTQVIKPLWGTTRTSGSFTKTVLPGPDLYSFFSQSGNQHLVTANDGLHPTYDDGTSTATDPAVWANNTRTALDAESGKYLVGNEWMLRLWRDALLSAVYTNSVAASDSATQSDSASLTATLATSDAGSLTEGVKVGPNGSDGATLAEAVALAPATGDSVTATDSAGLSASLAATDGATLTDAANVSGGTTPHSTDSATAVESASLTATDTASESGSLGESAAIAASVTETAAMTEAQAIALGVADAGTAGDAASLAVSLSASDGAALTDSAAINGAGTPHAADSATASDAGSVGAALGTGDAASATEHGALGLATLDTLLLSETPSLTSAAGVVDVVVLSESWSIQVQTTGADTLTVTDSGSWALTPTHLLGFFSVNSDTGSLGRTNSATGTLQRTNTG